MVKKPQKDLQKEQQPNPLWRRAPVRPISITDAKPKTGWGRAVQ